MEIRQKLTTVRERFLQCPKWARIALLCGCVIILCLLILVGVLAARGEAGEVSDAPGKDPVWPEVALTEGIHPPESWTLLSASESEDVVSVFFEGVTNGELGRYMASSGLSFSEKAPYIASTGDRLVILTHDGNGNLSIVIARTDS